MRHCNLFIIPLLVVSYGLAAAQTRQTDQVERTAAADREVVLTVCLGSGSVKISGWDRNEVRVRASHGMRIDFQRPIGNNAGLPRTLTLAADDNRPGMRSPCPSFGDLELDVPRGATLQLQTRNAEISVIAVARLSIKTQSGSVSVRQATSLVDVSTIGGDISVQDSHGAIKLHSVGGSIDVHRLGPNSAGDICEAGSVGGEIGLTDVSHEQVKVNSVNGDVSFNSRLARGGRYGFQTIGGDLSLSVPGDSSFRLSATLGTGELMSRDFPVRASSEAVDPPGTHRTHGNLQRLEVSYGTGDALITLSTLHGRVQLRKR